MRTSYLHRLTLRQIEIFLAVSRLRSYSRAADELALTQPAVSAQIRQIEQLVGEPLFTYLNKHIHITPTGEVMERVARDMQQRLIAAEMELAQLKGAIQGTLNICIESSAQYFIPKLVARFLRQHPDIKIHMEVDNRSGTLKRLNENRQEIVIMGSPPGDRSVLFTPFRENRLIMVAWPGHPLTARKQLSLLDLTNETLLLREPGSGTRLIIDEISKESAIDFHTFHQLGSNEGIVEAIKTNMGIALLPADCCLLEIEQRHLVELQVQGFPVKRSWCIVHRKDRALTPAGEKFKSVAIAAEI